MPPKKPRKPKTPAEQPKSEPHPDQEPDAPSNTNDRDDQAGTKSSSVPSKRKASTTGAPSKAPRRSVRGAPRMQPTPVKILQYLLSPASVDSCRSRDEIEDLKDRGIDLRTYSSLTFTPFEELICAVILSRPISHALGLRSIRTLLNTPYELTTPKRIRSAGFDAVRKALDIARTQHRQKTAEELVLLADAVVEHLGDGEEDVSLERVRKECGYNWEKVWIRYGSALNQH